MRGTYSPPNFPITVDGKALLEDFAIAEVFSSCYQDIFSVDSSIQNENELTLTIQNALRKDNLDLQHPFSVEEFDIALTSLKKNKSVGHDYIPNEFLINLENSSRTTLLKIFNTSWSIGIYPGSWKRSVVLPILKPSKDAGDPKSYRPINILPCPGKLMEKMVHNRLVRWLESNCILPSFQYGFRPERGTIDCLLHLDSLIHDTFKKREFALTLFIDLTSAFDLSNHLAILYKMALNNFTGKPLQWFQNFLQAREFYVSINGISSNSAPVRRGVPQGSVLSPSLFAILLSDIPTIDSVNVLMYADDITLISKSTNLLEAQTNLQQATNQLLEWTKRWGMLINPLKSVLLCFSKNRFNFIPSVSIEHCRIAPSMQHKYLGLIFDAPRLTWKPHIKYLTENCFQRLNVMRRLAGTSWGSSQETLLQIYQSYILGKLDYGNVIYGAAAKTKHCY